MPYTISPLEVQTLATLLSDYYERELEGGYRAAFDLMARSKMGLITAKLDLAKDTYLSLRAKGVDKFTTTFKAKMMTEFRVQTGNHSELIAYGVQAAAAALKAGIKHIPVPLLPSILNAGVDLAAGLGAEELHLRSIAEADADLATRIGTPQLSAMTVTDADASERAELAVSMYKEIAKLIKAMPVSIDTFEDAITYPGIVWRTQKAASSLNVSLRFLIVYLEEMELRLTSVQKLSRDGIQKVRTEMGGIVQAVLDKSWEAGNSKGIADVQMQKFQPLADPVLGRATEPGGASQLAVYAAHAFSSGYYFAGNRGPHRLRSNVVTEMPTRARSGGGPPPPPVNFRVGGHRG